MVISHQTSDPLDEFFHRTVQPPADLTERILANVRENGQNTEPVDEMVWLETALEASPVATKDDFTERTLARIRTGKRRGAHPWAWPGIVAAGLAASIALSILTVPQAPPAERDMATTRPFAPEDFAPPGLVDAEAARILALAESLDREARWLLHEDALTTLASAY